MAAVDAQTLFEESKCYLCYGVSQTDALKLALLNRIADSAGGFPAGTKIYRALLSQVGVNPPTATVLQNTLGSVAYNYVTPGQYNVVKSGAFPQAKTFIRIMNSDDVQNISFFSAVWSDVDTISFQSGDTGGAVGDSRLVFNAFEIIVFP